LFLLKEELKKKDPEDKGHKKYTKTNSYLKVCYPFCVKQETQEGFGKEKKVCFLCPMRRKENKLVKNQGR